MNRTLTVLKPGLATSVQDQGRSGYYHIGIPPSGAMDQYSFRAANLLAGNPETAAVLECTLMAPELRFNCDAIFAVAGAECDVKVNGQVQPADRAIAVKTGDTVSFGFMKQGARLYLAVNGGIDVPEVLGSRSTYTLGAFGGFQGRKLAAGDELPLGAPTDSHPRHTLPEQLRQRLDKNVSIRVIPGLYDYRLTDAGRASFYSDDWKVASEADRIGYRYKSGRPLQFKERTPPFGAGSDPSNIVDAPYPVGSIQVPSGQEPIILHRDAVSCGGYAMIATVISADMDLIGQMQPNYSARFVAVDMDTALAARRDYQVRLQQLREHFA